MVLAEMITKNGGNMGKVKRSVFEIIVIFVVVILTIVVSTVLYAGRSKVEKGNLLLSELGMLRSSLTTYKLMNKKNAASLSQLMSEKYNINGENKLYVEKLTKGKNDKLVDPFGNPYLYDQKTGWVSSATSGYERW